jgi:ACT domain-containing protein
MARNDTLALAGFRVVSPRTPEEAPYLALEQKVDAVIIGHSVEAELRATIIEAIRRLCPECSLLFVYTGQHQGEPAADASLDVSKGNEPLVSYLHARLPRRQAD